MSDEKKEVRRLREEVQRFDAALEALIDAEWRYGWQPPPKQSGACRRASMDLTRALADYRAGRPIGGTRD